MAQHWSVLSHEEVSYSEEKPFTNLRLQTNRKPKCNPMVCSTSLNDLVLGFWFECKTNIWNKKKDFMCFIFGSGSNSKKKHINYIYKKSVYCPYSFEKLIGVPLSSWENIFFKFREIWQIFRKYKLKKSILFNNNYNVYMNQNPN